MHKTFVGFGFGPIQSGLFLLEAFVSGNFERLVVAEVDDDVVHSIRSSKGEYLVNVAEAGGTSTKVVRGLQALNPLVSEDQESLVSAIAAADEIATALPSVSFFQRGSPSPAELLAAGIRRRLSSDSVRPLLVYVAENHNHAAEILREEVHTCLAMSLRGDCDIHVQFVNTVIGKMSGVVDDLSCHEGQNLEPLTGDSGKAVLVEQFNRVLIEGIRLADVQRGISVFEEKPDLLPFEEAKLYGHNAAHALMGYLACRRQMRYMSEVRGDELLEFVQHAFLVESGQPLCKRHAGIDHLFTPSGWENYVTDLMERMTNPYLQDRVERVVRDPRRKLSWDDRLIGTIRLALHSDVKPRCYTLGAAAALRVILRQNEKDRIPTLLEEIWNGSESDSVIRQEIIQDLSEAFQALG